MAASYEPDGNTLGQIVGAHVYFPARVDLDERSLTTKGLPIETVYD
jgi:hypothetical protein